MKIKVFILFLFFAGCVTPKATFVGGFDSFNINSILVKNFTSYDKFSNSGDIVKNYIIKHLIEKGYSVKESDDETVDFYMTGSVTKFLPERKYLIHKASSGDVIIEKLSTEISGSNVYNIGSAFGIPDSNVVVSNATVGVIARLVEKKSDKIVWSSSFVYEALTVETAADVVANYIVTSLVKRR